MGSRIPAGLTIFVFKLNVKGSAQAALKQIREKRYHEPYLTDGRKILLVAAAFSPKTRNLTKWLVEECPA
jgi:hypothetical protein